MTVAPSTERRGIRDRRGVDGAPSGIEPGMTARSHRPDGVARRARPTPTALLLIQLVLGYEWLASGLSHLSTGDFPGGLAEHLRSDARPAGWYRSFLDAAIIPHAPAVGYAIAVAELLAGGLLIAGALTMLFLHNRVSIRAELALQLATAGAFFAGIVMAVNFHLAMGAAQPWALPRGSFDEAVDLDSLIVALQLALLAAGIATVRSLRRALRPEDSA